MTFFDYRASPCDRGGERGCRGVSAVVLLAAVLLPCITMAQTSSGRSGGLGGGTVSGDVRYRFEYVDQSNGLDSAKASTLRTRLGYRTPGISGGSAYVEFEDVRVVGGEDYNSTVNGKTAFSVVADPQVTEVNQGYVELKGVQDSRLRLGRERIILDNARFVGNVGWRQNEQTFDGLSFMDAAISGMTVNYAYVHNVNTVTGDDVGMESHLMNIHYKTGPVRFSAYAYLIDFNDAPADSSKSIGVRAVWAQPLAQINGRMAYTLEYANQSAYDKGDSRIGADYIFGEANAVFSDKSMAVGYEVLGADDYSGFETPLATKHAFNGWADMFTNTPTDGLKDLYFAVGVNPPGGYTFKAMYHMFTAQRGGGDYGNEFDILLAQRITGAVTIMANYANYQAQDFGVDTQKAWLSGEVTF